MAGLALIIVLASTVVLAAVAASGLGPAKSLRRTVGRYRELLEELESLQRRAERFAARATEIAGQASLEPATGAEEAS